MDVPTPDPASLAEDQRKIEQLSVLLSDATKQIRRWTYKSAVLAGKVNSLEEQNLQLKCRLDQAEERAIAAQAALAQRATQAEERAQQAEERLALIEGAGKWLRLFDAELERRGIPPVAA